MSENKISDIIESICQQGCNSVNDVIDSLEKGEIQDHGKSLNAADRIQLIKELKEIMSVYDR